MCNDTDLNVISRYLNKVKLSEVLRQDEICELHVFKPYCQRGKVFVDAILVAANITKFVPISNKVCGIRCRKATHDKVAQLLNRNLGSILQKPIVFRLLHHHERLAPIQQDNKRRLRAKRGRSKKHKSSERTREPFSHIRCPAGYSYQNSNCIPCGVGFYSADGSSYCKKCPVGSHQPNIGSQTCRACTNPFAEGCRNMIWNSSSIIFIVVITACVSIMISIITMLIVICVRRKCRKKQCKTENSSTKMQQPCEEVIPLIQCEKDCSDDDNASDSDDKQKSHNIKEKYKKYGDERKVEKNFVIVNRNELEKNDKDGKKKKRKIIGFQYVPVACLQSYRTHRGHNLSKGLNQKKPPIPIPDFEKEIHHL